MRQFILALLAATVLQSAIASPTSHGNALLTRDGGLDDADPFEGLASAIPDESLPKIEERQGKRKGGKRKGKFGKGKRLNDGAVESAEEDAAIEGEEEAAPAVQPRQGKGKRGKRKGKGGFGKGKRFSAEEGEE